MKDIQYLFFKVLSRVLKNREIQHDFFRRQGAQIGGGCNIVGNISTPESYLIKIGDNTTVANDVQFVTHDNSIMKVDPHCYNLFGYITIGDNCFVGQRSTLMYGVTLANNIIVASGSVVVNSFDEERIIIGGNPAKKIGTWDDFAKKGRAMARGKLEVKKCLIDHPEKFVTKPTRKK